MPRTWICCDKENRTEKSAEKGKQKVFVIAMTENRKRGTILTEKSESFFPHFVWILTKEGQLEI